MEEASPNPQTEFSKFQPFHATCTLHAVLLVPSIFPSFLSWVPGRRNTMLQRSKQNVCTTINGTDTGSLLHMNIGYQALKALFIRCNNLIWCVCPSFPFLRTGPLGSNVDTRSTFCLPITKVGIASPTSGLNVINFDLSTLGQHRFYFIQFEIRIM
jgi:hypothetical protein